MFYARVREHKILGPVFLQSLPDNAKIWEVHEAKIAAFWRNAILLERSYNGNPQHVHRAREAIKPEHFAIWLALFDEVLNEELTPDIAASWPALAHRIGRGLKMGIEQSRQAEGAVPMLR